MVKVLGISASLRNARYGVGSAKLIEEIRQLSDTAALKAYLEQQSKIRADDFIAAGRKDKLPFDQIYRNLQKERGERGLSNSEASLVAGLWGALKEGADIAHTGLSQYFPMNGELKDLDKLKQIVLDSDAILLSGPVYFGDRGSLAQEFIEFLGNDPEVSAHIKDKIYGGIAVGAKRNGGQETTLIYQMIDMANLNMLAVGNSWETTSQYGGTTLAGDVGTLWKDDYGIETAIGTGIRIARVSRMLDRANHNTLKDKIRIAVWLMQDSNDHRGLELISELCRQLQDDRVIFDIKDFTHEAVYRCIACDACPIEVGTLEEYRCIIKNKEDIFCRDHAHLIEPDAILLAAYSPINRRSVKSIYQKFVERTRYLRRDDYAFSDRLIAPLVISELNANQNLHLRMLTSFIRHNTILHHPLIAMEQQGKVLNWDYLVAQGQKFVANAVRIVAGRLSQSEEEVGRVAYNPIGYTVSAEKLKDSAEQAKKQALVEARKEAYKREQDKRIQGSPSQGGNG